MKLVRENSPIGAVDGIKDTDLSLVLPANVADIASGNTSLKAEMLSDGALISTDKSVFATTDRPLLPPNCALKGSAKNLIKTAKLPLEASLETAEIPAGPTVDEGFESTEVGTDSIKLSAIGPVNVPINLRIRDDSKKLAKETVITSLNNVKETTFVSVKPAL